MYSLKSMMKLARLGRYHLCYVGTMCMFADSHKVTAEKFYDTAKRYVGRDLGIRTFKHYGISDSFIIYIR